MDTLYLAVSLAFLRKNRIVITTDRPSSTIRSFHSLVLNRACQLSFGSFIDIDLLEAFDGKGIRDLVLRMSSYAHSHHTFKNVIVWRNIQLLSQAQQKQLFELLTTIDEYDTNASRWTSSGEVLVEGIVIRKPPLFTIIPVLNHSYHDRKIYQYLKEKFWFSVNYHFESEQESIQEASKIVTETSYEAKILELRQSWSKVHVSPDIKKYIYSLIVHTRNHRLTSLAPKQTRLSTRIIDSVRDLTIALVLWRNEQDMLYVTPDFVKVAVRRIGYWLIDWEYNRFFSDSAAHSSPEDEYRKRIEIDILTGDWFGSDYRYVEAYLQSAKSVKDAGSPTAFSNCIVEDALAKVAPPI